MIKEKMLMNVMVSMLLSTTDFAYLVKDRGTIW